MIETRKSSGHTLRCAGRRRCDPREIRLHKLSGGVLDPTVVDFVLNGVNQLDVTDRTRCLLHQARNPFVSLAAEADGPVYGGGGANLRLPLGANLRQKIGEDVGGAAAVGAVNDNDVVAGQLDPRIRLGDFGIVPLCDLPQVDSGERLLA